MNTFEFKSHNDWSSCTIGKCVIVVDSDGRVSHVTHGRIFKTSEDAQAYISARPKLVDGLREWMAARCDAVRTWKHETPHYRYSCDRGSLAVRANGMTALVHNIGGDGNFPVYILEDSSSIPPTFSPTPTMLEFDEPTNVEVMDYDCDGAHVMERFCAKNVEFYRDGEGAIAVVAK